MKKLTKKEKEKIAINNCKKFFEGKRFLLNRYEDQCHRNLKVVHIDSDAKIIVDVEEVIDNEFSQDKIIRLRDLYRINTRDVYYVDDENFYDAETENFVSFSVREVMEGDDVVSIRVVDEVPYDVINENDLLNSLDEYQTKFLQEKTNEVNRVPLAGLLKKVPFYESYIKMELPFCFKRSGEIRLYSSGTEIGMLKRLSSKDKSLVLNKANVKHLKKIRCSELSVWDTVRKLENDGFPDYERFSIVGVQNRDIESVRWILKQTYFEDGKEKKVFPTLEGLLNFVERVDRYQAISVREVFPLLKDYLKLCKFLDMKPNTESDSLKREHDVCSRLAREKRDEVYSGKIEEKYNDYLKYYFSNEKWFIRPIKNSEDLLDEAKQQGNCLACYGKYIASGYSKIFTMRRRETPDKSLVSIELDRGNHVVQKYLAFNQKIYDKEMNEFISDFEKYAKEIG